MSSFQKQLTTEGLLSQAFCNWRGALLTGMSLSAREMGDPLRLLESA